jgi:hypothetical protein
MSAVYSGGTSEASYRWPNTLCQLRTAFEGCNCFACERGTDYIIRPLHLYQSSSFRSFSRIMLFSFSMSGLTNCV